MANWLDVPMSFDTVFEKIRRRGGYVDALSEKTDMEAVVRQVQKTLGVKDVDGVLGPITLRALDAPKICGCPDRMEFGAGVNKWPQPRVLVSIQGSVPSMSLEDFKATITECFKKWNSVCGIKFEYSENSKTAHADVFSVHIDGKYKVLADSSVVPQGLSRNEQFRGRQRYDSGEDFSAGFEQPHAGQISLGVTALHELGHLLGVGHLPRGLLHASYQFVPSGFAENDPAVDEAQARYGKPTQGAPPLLPPSGTATQKPIGSLLGWSLYSPAVAGHKFSLHRGN